MQVKQYLLITIIIGAVSLYGQDKNNYTISGRVLEINESIPLEYANVVLFSSKDSAQVAGTVTNSDGFFTIENVNRDKYYIRISFIGFDDYYISDFSLDNYDIDLGDLFLNPQSFGIEDVVISGERPPITYEIDKKVINVSEQLTSLSGTAVDVLENVPSVTVDIEGNVALRGSGNFQVLIDGRPTILEANEALQQIPASTIENIEIITNPSAKYNPEGTAGIINLVMKKSKLVGISGLMELNGGLNNKYGIEGFVEYKTNFFQGNLGIDLNNRIYEGTNEEYRWTEVDGTKNYVSSEGTSTRNRESFSIRGGGSLNFGLYDNFSFGGRYRDRLRGRTSNNNYTEWSDATNETSFYNNISDGGRGGIEYSMFGNFMHKFNTNGHEIQAEIDYEFDDSDEESINELLENGVIIEGRKNVEFGPGSELRTKIDYTLPFGTDQKFEAGYQGENEISEETTGMFEFFPAEGDYIENLEFSRNTRYNKNVYALYSIYADKINRFGYQVGLRTEYTYREISQVNRPEKSLIERWDYFPSAHLSFDLSEGNQTMASYTRRINRPRGWELEPFETWSDAYNVRKGNPNLLPEYIDSYELGYQTIVGKSIFSVEAYYRYTKNKIERVRSVYSENIKLSSVENVGKDYALGTELFINFDPYEIWNVNLMGNLYDYKVEGELEGEDFSRTSFNWNLRFNNNLKITSNSRLQLNLLYNSPTVSSQGRVEGYFYSNLAFRQDFFEKQFAVTLQVRDLFGTAKRERLYEGAEFYDYSLGKRESPLVMVNLRFNFNNYKSRERNNNGGEGMGMDGDEF